MPLGYKDYCLHRLLIYKSINTMNECTYIFTKFSILFWSSAFEMKLNVAASEDLLWPIDSDNLFDNII